MCVACSTGQSLLRRISTAEKVMESESPTWPPHGHSHTNLALLLLGERAALYGNLASAAESGWDFSSRWFSHNGSHVGQLPSIRTSQVVPVDLNAILCQNEATLERLFRAVGM